MNDLQNQILAYLKQHYPREVRDILSQTFATEPGFEKAINDLEAMGRIRVERSSRHAAREILIVELLAPADA